MTEVVDQARMKMNIYELNEDMQDIRHRMCTMMTLTSKEIEIVDEEED